MFNRDPFQIYHDNVNKNIERMKREKRLVVSSQPMFPASQKRQPLSHITSQFNSKHQISKINKPITSTRNLLSKFVKKPKKEILKKSYDFKLLNNRGLNNTYKKIEKEFAKDIKDPVVNSFIRHLETFTNWFKLNKFQYKVAEKAGEESKTKKVIKNGIVENTIKSSYVRPEYSKMSIQASHTILHINKLSDFMYVVKVSDNEDNEKIVMLMITGDCNLKVNDRINLKELSYKMDYKGKDLEVFIRWQLVV